MGTYSDLVKKYSRKQPEVDRYSNSTREVNKDDYQTLVKRYASRAFENTDPYRWAEEVNSVSNSISSASNLKSDEEDYWAKTYTSRMEQLRETGERYRSFYTDSKSISQIDDILGSIPQGMDYLKNTGWSRRKTQEEQERDAGYAAYDLTAGQKEIDNLNAELKRLRDEKNVRDAGGMGRPYAAWQTEAEDAQYTTGYGIVNSRPYAAGLQAQRQDTPTEDPIRELEEQISRKKQAQNLARRTQELAAYDDTVTEADFDQYDDYIESEDVQYNWINDPQYREEYEAQYGAAHDAAFRDSPFDVNLESRFTRKGYDRMNAGEIAIYNYYYAKGGKEAAQKYLDTIQERLNARTAEDMFSTVQDDVAAELVVGVPVGLDQFGSNVVNNFRFRDDYIPQSAYQIASGMVREDLADDGWKLPQWLGGASLGQVAYDTVTTSANMAPSILVGLATGVPMAGTAMMGLSAAGGAYQQALNEGYDKDQARGYSILVGISEVAMERVLGGISAVGGNKVGKKVAKNLANADTALKAIGRQLGGSMLSEFREEYLQEVLDTVFRNIMLKTDEEVELFSPEAFYSGILGALTGGFAEGPAAVSNGVKTGSTLVAGKTAGVYFDYGGGNVVAFSDAHKGGLSKTQATGVRAAALLHKLGIGGDVYFFESYRNKEGELVCRDAAGKEVAAPNGWYSQKDGSIHIDLRAGRDEQGYVLYTLSHELTHFVEQWSAQKYTALADFLVENYGQGQSAESLITEKQKRLSDLRGEAVTYEEAYSEFIADSMEAMLSDGNVLEKLTELRGKDRSLVEKIKAFFDDLLGKITTAYSGLQPDSEEGRAVVKMTESIEGIQQLFTDALTEASENYRSAEKNTTEEGGVRFMSREEGNRIKAQITAVSDQLNQMDAAVSVTTDGFVGMRKSDIAKAVEKEYSKFGKKVDRQNFGIVLLEFQQINKALEYLNTDGEKAALLTVPRVLKRGIVADMHTEHKERGIDSITFAAPVQINGKRGNVGVVVQRVSGTNRFKTLRILLPNGKAFEFEKNTEADSTTGSSSKQNGSEGIPIESASRLSIRDGAGKVNGKANEAADDSHVEVSGSVAPAVMKSEHDAEPSLGQSSSAETVGESGSKEDVAKGKDARHVTVLDTDVSKLTRTELEEIARRVARGERLSFGSKTEKSVTGESGAQKDSFAESDIKYSIREAFYKEFDAWDQKDTNVTFVTGTTSDALKSIGMKDQEIVLRSGTVLQKLKDHPEMTLDIFKGIPDLLEHPVVVQFSDAINPKTKRPKYESSITVLGELYADVKENGKSIKKPVLVSMELLPTNQKKTAVLDFAIIKSAYSKNALQQYLNDNSILYIEPNKKRTDSWLSLNRLQLPLGENRYGPVRKIAYVDGKVKVQNAKSMTEMQRRLFEAGAIDEFGNKLFSDRDTTTASGRSSARENISKEAAAKGNGPRPVTVLDADVSKLTRAELEEIARRVARGERLSFGSKAENGNKETTEVDNGFQKAEKSTTGEGGVQMQIREVVGQSGKNYGIGVYLDSDILTNVPDDQREAVVRGKFKKFGGMSFVAYDNAGNPQEIMIASSEQRFKNAKGKRPPVNEHITSFLKNPIKRETLVLIDEVITASSFGGKEDAIHPHDWLDNNGKNQWDIWTVFLQEKNEAVWEATLKVANSANGEKILYELYPIKEVEAARKPGTSSTK